MWRKCPQGEKKCVHVLYSKFYELFFILNRSYYWKWCYFMLVPNVDMIEIKKKWWRYLSCKYHLGGNKRCDKNVPCLASDQIIQGLHCSCLTPSVMVQTACRKNMISASIQQMLHLGCIIQWFSNLDLPFESSEVSQNQRRSKHNWAGVGGEHCGYCRWGWSLVPFL